MWMKSDRVKKKQRRTCLQIMQHMIELKPLYSTPSFLCPRTSHWPLSCGIIMSIMLIISSSQLQHNPFLHLYRNLHYPDLAFLCAATHHQGKQWQYYITQTLAWEGDQEGGGLTWWKVTQVRLKCSYGAFRHRQASQIYLGPFTVEDRTMMDGTWPWPPFYLRVPFGISGWRWNTQHPSHSTPQTGCWHCEEPLEVLLKSKWKLHRIKSESRVPVDSDDREPSDVERTATTTILHRLM